MYILALLCWPVSVCWASWSSLFFQFCVCVFALFKMWCVSSCYTESLSCFCSYYRALIKRRFLLRVTFSSKSSYVLHFSCYVFSSTLFFYFLLSLPTLLLFISIFLLVLFPLLFLGVNHSYVTPCTSLVLELLKYIDQHLFGSLSIFLRPISLPMSLFYSPFSRAFLEGQM